MPASKTLSDQIRARNLEIIARARRGSLYLKLAHLFELSEDQVRNICRGQSETPTKQKRRKLTELLDKHPDEPLKKLAADVGVHYNTALRIRKQWKKTKGNE